MFGLKAISEAKKYLDVEVLASSKDKNYSYIPQLEKIEGDYDYVHITLNNTIMGTKWDYLPDTGAIPLVADVSSNILSEPLDITKFGLIYAGAQKLSPCRPYACDYQRGFSTRNRNSWNTNYA